MLFKVEKLFRKELNKYCMKIQSNQKGNIFTKGELEKFTK